MIASDDGTKRNIMLELHFIISVCACMATLRERKKNCKNFFKFSRFQNIFPVKKIDDLKLATSAILLLSNGSKRQT